jgi:hypothetical protein
LIFSPLPSLLRNIWGAHSLYQSGQWAYEHMSLSHLNIYFVLFISCCIIRVVYISLSPSF